jgi:hypothetical protein
MEGLSNLPPGCNSADGGIDHDLEAVLEYCDDMLVESKLSSAHMKTAVRIGITIVQSVLEEIIADRRKHDSAEARQRRKRRPEGGVKWKQNTFTAMMPWRFLLVWMNMMNHCQDTVLVLVVPNTESPNEHRAVRG